MAGESGLERNFYEKKNILRLQINYTEALITPTRLRFDPTYILVYKNIFEFVAKGESAFNRRVYIVRLTLNTCWPEGKTNNIGRQMTNIDVWRAGEKGNRPSWRRSKWKSDPSQ